jgi:hypothetical protein
VESQSAAVKVSNVSANNLDVVITTFGDGGHMLAQRNETLAPGATSSLVVIAKGGPLSFRATVALGSANSAVSDIMTFDETTGQVIAILPFIELPTP